MSSDVITEAQRNELRRRAAREVVHPVALFNDTATIEVDPRHLLDLLDAADREAES